jgi:hypothetical protein
MRDIAVGRWAFRRSALIFRHGGLLKRSFDILVHWSALWLSARYL